MTLCIISLLVAALAILAGLRWDMNLKSKSLGEYKKPMDIFAVVEDYLLHFSFVKELRIGEMSKPVTDYLRGRLSIFILCLLLGSLVGLLSGVFSSDEIISQGNTIIRNEYGKGNKTVAVTGEIDGESKDYEINISERQYTAEEAHNLLKECMDELDKILLGENSSFDKVIYDINPVSNLKDGLVNVVWHFSDYEVIDGNGHIQSKQLRRRLNQAGEDGFNLEVSAVLSYRDCEEKYEKQLYLQEPGLDSREAIIKALEDSLEEEDENSIHDETMKLPEEVEGRKVNWSEPVQDNGAVFTILGLVAAVGICFGRANEEKKRQLIRSRQMEGDYPEFISKLTLMLSAGMSFNNAWDRMGEEYKEYKEKNPGYSRFLYEEMVITSREIQGGLSIRTGIENFCGRLKLPAYKRFGTLLLQSMDKGMSGLCQSLDYEVMQAFQEKKAKTQIMGEEASTKLLLPMGILLFIVLIIVIAPAFMSIGV